MRVLISKCKAGLAVLSDFLKISRSAPTERTTSISIPSLSEPLLFILRSPIDEYRIGSLGGESASINLFATMLKPTDVVYDIGAQLGIYTVVASMKAHMGCVYSFEPDTELRERLAQNIELNRRQNIKILPFAVAATSGTETLFTDGESGFSPSLRLQSRAGACTGSITVDSISIDDAITRLQIRPPDILKIDIEGAEWHALLGMKVLFASRPPRLIFIEFHPQFLPLFGSSLAECLSLLESARYISVRSESRGNELQMVYEHASNETAIATGPLRNSD